MSSSAEPPFGWDAFTRRPAPEDAEPASPAAEVATVLKLYQAAVREERRRGRATADDILATAVEQAALVARLRAALARNDGALEEASLGRVRTELRILTDQMEEALGAGGITFHDPIGAPFDQVADRVEVVAWRTGAEYAHEMVAETKDAIVLHNGAVIRPGQVVMGAPPAEDDKERA